MIPELPNSVSTKDKLAFYSTLVGNLDDQSTVHVNWHTHRQNPSVCWICDMTIIAQKILTIADGLIPKSALDIRTELSSEDESDSEIENDPLEEITDLEDAEDYNEPEYDVEDER